MFQGLFYSCEYEKNICSGREADCIGWHRLTRMYEYGIQKKPTKYKANMSEKLKNVL